jgi:hypothetical protein
LSLNSILKPSARNVARCHPTAPFYTRFSYQASKRIAERHGKRGPYGEKRSEGDRICKRRTAESGSWSPFEEENGERGKGEAKRIRTPLARVVSGALAADVAHVGSAIVPGVGVENFFVETGAGDADDVAFANDGSGIEDDDHQVVGTLAAAKEGKNAVFTVVAVNPLEALPLKIDFVKGGFGGEEMVEIGNEFLNAAMGIPLEQMPVEAASLAPFVSLAKFLAHEEQLLAGVRILIGEQQPEIGELLPEIARHFMEERIFPVDDFIVRERQHEIFAERVNE